MAAAVLAANLVGSPPIYDSLRQRMPAEALPDAESTSGRDEAPQVDSPSDADATREDGDNSA